MILGNVSHRCTLGIALATFLAAALGTPALAQCEPQIEPFSAKTGRLTITVLLVGQ